MKNTIEEVIAKKTIPFEELSKDFTLEQKAISLNEIFLYEALQAIKKARKQLKLTQEELARKAKLPRTTITKIESGMHNPTIQTLMTIAAAMNKTLVIQLQ